ncbi:hypothetical protein K9N68_05985 [Kovacikia minuta CCNUW1]|uniref:hypothetical protein n=1 Tax=Kovacikia minuta TaxID=2931930 RepID=UPI001CCF7613|nr:hypothetical protein [Kovacikia minuta]UBF27490.1 hypothetical protein K9N68_05985 [Kovacikia minuta CCNUW1]
MNKTLVRRAAAALGLIVAIAPTLAQAAPASYAPFKDSEGNIWISGTPNTETIVTFGSVEKMKDVKADACGLVKLTPSTSVPLTSPFRVDGTTINPATLSTDILPKCTNGTLEQSRPSNFKTSDGKIYVVGKTAGSYYKLAYNVPVEKRVKANACGIGRIASSASIPFTSTTQFAVGVNDPITYGNLSTSEPWVCRSGVTYMPYGGT